MAHTVKVVAELAGISIRTLHHYDEIGLLSPAQVSPSGYRLYTDQELERLQQVLFFRELGFPLGAIKEMIEHPGFDRKEALLAHKALLRERQERLGRLIQSIDRTVLSMERGITVTAKELFDGFEPAKYEEEARQRWGHTDEYQESRKRTNKYTKEDWAAIKAEGADISEALAALMDRSPSDPEVQAWIRRHHQMINDRFYTCSTEVYRGLGDLYVGDERFTQNFDKLKSGLAQFMRDAMHAYCDKLERK